MSKEKHFNATSYLSAINGAAHKQLLQLESDLTRETRIDVKAEIQARIDELKATKS